jgi:hypothetical protein
VIAGVCAVAGRVWLPFATDVEDLPPLTLMQTRTALLALIWFRSAGLRVSGTWLSGGECVELGWVSLPPERGLHREQETQECLRACPLLAVQVELRPTDCWGAALRSTGTVSKRRLADSAADSVSVFTQI